MKGKKSEEKIGRVIILTIVLSFFILVIGGFILGVLGVIDGFKINEKRDYCKSITSGCDVHLCYVANNISHYIDNLKSIDDYKNCKEIEKVKSKIEEYQF